jgi:hypothetical protein
MNIIRVTDRNTEKMFLNTAREIYKNDKTWVCPLDKDIKAVFDPGLNTYFRHGTVERWVVTDDHNKLTAE